MPQTEFNPENRMTQPWDYPKLHLKYGDRERVNVIQKAIDYEFTHEVKAPILLNGQPVMETVKRKDGTEYERKKPEFLGRVLCLGREDVLASKAKDPEMCPLCKVADNSDYLQLPARRFATHVFVYNTVQENFDVISPFSGKLVAWVFGERTFNTISEAAAEWADVGPNGEKVYTDILRKHDLLLGPCISEDFQNYDIRVAREAAWLLTPEAQAFTAALWRDENNHAPDLAALIAKRRDATAMQQMADLVTERNRQADGLSSVPAAAPNGPVSPESLLDSVGRSAPVPQPVPANPEAVAVATGQVMAVPDLDAPVAPVEAPVPSPEPAVAPQAQPEQVQPAPTTGDTPSFKDLLADLPD